MKFCPQCQAALAPRHIDGRERLACSSSNCGFVFWANPTPVAAGLVIHEDKFLLARNAQWPPGRYSLITGFPYLPIAFFENGHFRGMQAKTLSPRL